MKFIALTLIILIQISCSKSKDLIHLTGSTMGTYYSVKLYSDQDKENLKVQVEEVLKEVNQVFSTYITDSEISRINQSSGEIEITPVFKEVLDLSLKINNESNGAFDPTVGPLVNLWGFGPNKERLKPSDKEIQKALENSGLNKLKIKENKLIKPSKEIYIDFSAIAKGQGVDDLGLVLESRGITDYLVEIGGEVRARGKKPDGKSWLVGIEKPSEKLGEAIQKVIKLDNLSIATSGGYRNYLKYGDKVFTHTIDPKTGYPVTHKLVSVSVLHKDCAVADAWATALMVLGDEKGLDIANRTGLKAYFLVKKDKDFIELKTENFKEFL